MRGVFKALDELERRLSRQRYVAGARITEADWRLFPTLVRFDAVYHGHFKCNVRRIADYPNLSNYLRDLYQVPGVAETVSLEHIKRHYYMQPAEGEPDRHRAARPRARFHHAARPRAVRAANPAARPEQWIGASPALRFRSTLQNLGDTRACSRWSCQAAARRPERIRAR